MEQHIYLNIMAGSHICYNPACFGEDEIAKNISTKGNNTLTSFPAIFWAQTPAFAQVFASILGLLGMNTDICLQRAIRLALKLFIQGQEYGQL